MASDTSLGWCVTHLLAAFSTTCPTSHFTEDANSLMLNTKILAEVLPIGNADSPACIMHTRGTMRGHCGTGGLPDATHTTTPCVFP